MGENELPESYVDQVRLFLLRISSTLWALLTPTSALNAIDQIEGFLKAHLPVPSPAPTPAFEMTGFPGAPLPRPPSVTMRD